MLQPRLLHWVKAGDEHVRRRCALCRDGELPKQRRFLPARQPTLLQLLGALNMLLLKLEDLTRFDSQGYRFMEADSDENIFVFSRPKPLPVSAKR